MKTKPRIAVFSELPFGGASRAEQELSKQLSKYYEVISFSGVLALSPTGKGVISRLKHDFSDLIVLALAHRRLAQQIDAGKFQAVIVHPSRWTQAPFLLFWLKTQTVYYCQEPLRLVYDPAIAKADQLTGKQRFYERLNRSWRKWIDALNTSKASLILANSHFSADWIREAYGRAATVCYLGVDAAQFKPETVKKKYDILFLGATDHIEGYDLLLAAAKTASQKWKIKVVSRKSDGTHIADSELIHIINECRIAVCLSIHEPFGLLALEAGSCGLPIVAVNEGGYRETIMDGKNGYLVKRDPQKLADKIDVLLASEKLQSSMGKEGRRLVESSWTWKQSGVSLTQVLQSLLNTKRNKSQLRTGYTVIAYVFSVLASLFLFRLGFRLIRGFAEPAPVVHGAVGYSQYFGYSLTFETYYFLAMMLIPILMALMFRIFAKGRS